jgi:hypothetical protein
MGRLNQVSFCVAAAPAIIEELAIRLTPPITAVDLMKFLLFMCWYPSEKLEHPAASAAFGHEEQYVRPTVPSQAPVAFRPMQAAIYFSQYR